MKLFLVPSNPSIQFSSDWSDCGALRRSSPVPRDLAPPRKFNTPNADAPSLRGPLRDEFDFTNPSPSIIYLHTPAFPLSFGGTLRPKPPGPSFPSRLVRYLLQPQLTWEPASQSINPSAHCPYGHRHHHPAFPNGWLGCLSSLFAGAPLASRASTSSSSPTVGHHA